MTTIFLSAGELSGDAHGARLAEALFKQQPSLSIVGFGGPKMRAAGVRIIHDMTHTSIVGIVEAFRFIPSYFSSLKKIVSALREIQPDVFIPIDNQGFHMMVLNKIKDLPCKKIYYIAPQEWQWGTIKGGQKVGRLVDHILSIFPKEHAFYDAIGAPSTFIGHPIVDLTPTQAGPKVNDHCIGIFPGSRRQEIQHVAPILIQAASAFSHKHSGYSFVISVSNDRYRSELQEIVKSVGLHSVSYSSEPSSVVIGTCKASLTTSGTITFEHALMETPAVVAYKFHPITYFIAKTIMKKQTDKIKYMSLPNIILDKPCFPEFLQHKAKPEVLANELESIIMEPSRFASIQEDCRQLRKQLGSSGVTDRAANIILSII